MKILLVTGAIYAQNSSRKHFTGLDYVVTQIGQSLSNDNEELNGLVNASADG